MVAAEVVCLFTAGNHKTVLLLVNGEEVSRALKVSIMEEMANQKVATHKHVVTLLNCIRRDSNVKSDNVFLTEMLSDSEKKNFNDKKAELKSRFGDKCNRFHGFNIMQSNFSEAYIQDACSVFKTIERTEGTQLAALLSLLNAYVPDSYLLESQCLDMIKRPNMSLEGMLENLSHLIITIQQDGSEAKVRMAHPMIAQCCTELLAEAGVTRSDTAKEFLRCLCRGEVPPFLAAFVKIMLTKRRPKQKAKGTEENPINRTEKKEESDLFSRLILHIHTKEADDSECASVLEMATDTFDQNPFFPQALARFYCLKLKDYDKAETWANEAKKRDPQNSFVADTLGHVHKHRLKNLRQYAKPEDILNLAIKAFKAFEEEERLAEQQLESNVKKDGNIHVSNVFNSRGLFGYLQVCNLVFDLLVSQNQTWRDVLTKKESLNSVLGSLGDSSLIRFSDLMNKLRDEVEKKCAFFDRYLTYSKPSIEEDDPEYISRETSACYWKYVGDSTSSPSEKGADLIQKLKLKHADTTTGVLACLDRECPESDLKEITTLWEDTRLHKDPDTAEVNNIFAHIMLRNMSATLPPDCKHLTAFKQKLHPIPTAKPEPYMLALLLHWPTDPGDTCNLDLSTLINHAQQLYKQAYAKHLRARYLRPLFFIGKGQGLDRIVHRNVLEGRQLETMQFLQQSDEKIFQTPWVKKHLLKVRGEIQEYKLFVTVNGKKIEVAVNLQNSLWKNRKVCFYLGFTIEGPVAFAINTETAEQKEKLPERDTSKQQPPYSLKFGACCSEMDARDLTELDPEVNRVDDVQTYSLQSDAGNYECRVSGLRWVCKEKVSFKYRFLSWEDHMKSPCDGYTPAGPLMDITVTTGVIEEVHLPHSVSVDQNSTFSGEFAVLHVDASDVLEKVPKVTSSHIKFLQPTFPPKGVLIRKMEGIPFYQDVLIHKTSKEFLTLEVHVVPRGSAQQEVEGKQKSCGSMLILKQSLDKSMRIGDPLALTTDQADAIIQPSDQEFGYESLSFEVFIRNADSDFALRLGSGENTVWTGTIHKGDYQN
ncbi:hypothetical protein PBY51_005881 [Eleginops maclovinus]|uniref:FIIND domain-containing protein n=2 Tax=Eleginops maclovinus TaxID=56733 RepID=A0AAN7WBP2_ELEMC|nr:hypothetical protein PBY51_005881 [Eleginops maclovinus]